MDIKLYNTATKKKEVFKPLQDGKVGMYHCGPTVYNYVHIGNLRSYIFADILRRVFEYNGYKVNQVINITDIGHLSSDADTGEDKMTLALKRENKPITLDSMRELANFYEKAFESDLEKLNIKKPNHLPFASDHIKESIDLISKLEEKGFTYEISDGVYFDTKRYPEYGRLGGVVNEDERMARLEENKEKKSKNDFALWKFNEKQGFPSPWGKGFPGWHIECSGMSKKYLGETIDIHTGGPEHIQIHHNNEIAQSENANDKPFVNYWVHGEWINMKGEKMAKSLGNVIYLSNLEEKNIEPLAYRYLILQANYASPMNFSWQALEGSQKALNRLRNTLASLGDAVGEVSEDYRNQFLELINDNLNIPEALALVWEIFKDKKLSNKDKRATILDFDKVFGLKVEEFKETEINPNIQKLLDERELARKKEDWETADKLREEIEGLGYKIQDK